MKELFQKQLVKRNKPVNIEPADEIYFEHEYEVEIPASFLLTLQPAYLLRDAIFSLKGFKFYWPFTHFVVPALRNKVSRLRLLLKKKQQVLQAVWATNEWSLGYFHWMTDVLPRLLAVKKHTECKEIVLPEAYSGFEFVTSSLKKLGFTPDFYDPNAACVADELILPSFTAPTGNYNVTLMNELRDVMTSDIKKNPSKRIYISRKKARVRRILNEDELIEALRLFDFEIHYFEDYTLDKQIEIMREASVLLGLHGAGLTNMLFMNEGTKLFELRNYFDAQNNCYFSLASALGIRYYYQFNQGDKKETHDVGIHVDVQKLRQTLQAIFIE